MQRGHIRRVGNVWMFRYYETVSENGQLVKRRVAKRLAKFGPEYRTEKDVRPLADLILAPINAKTARVESTDTVASFLQTYLANCDETLRPSTCKNYRDMHKLIESHLGDVRLRAFGTPEVDKLLQKAADEKRRAHTTHRNLKNYLSGAFRFAKRKGLVAENPVRDAAIPRGLPSGKTHAYTMDEIQAMLAALNEPCRTIVLLAALTGLRLSEIKGLRWEDFSGDELNVARSVWMGKVSETKTLSSHAPVPVLPLVAEALEDHRKRSESADGFIFCARNGNPLRMENVLRRDMLPAFKKQEKPIAWRGWHAFRRGLATNLYALAVPDKTIQAILRHANVATTLAYCIRPVAADSQAAMKKLDKAFRAADRKSA